MQALKIRRDPLAPFACLWQHRRLAAQLAARDIKALYRGAVLGSFWAIIQPLLYLGVFVFVFTVIFPSRGAVWGSQVPSQADFALAVFLALIIFWLVSDCVARAPSLVRRHAELVQNVVFPIEILPWVTLGEAAFHAGVRFVIFLVAFVVVHGAVPWTVALLPVILVPLVLITLGVSWALAAIGTFARDLDQIINVIMTAAMFISAVFYPATLVPEAYRGYFMLNPLAFTIEQARRAAMWGEPPAWPALCGCLAAGFVLAWLGLRWFARSRGRFADVL
jgi:lipopolysaccharide transport system permease protein